MKFHESNLFLTVIHVFSHLIHLNEIRCITLKKPDFKEERELLCNQPETATFIEEILSCINFGSEVTSSVLPALRMLYVGILNL